MGRFGFLIITLFLLPSASLAAGDSCRELYRLESAREVDQAYWKSYVQIYGLTGHGLVMAAPQHYWFYFAHLKPLKQHLNAVMAILRKYTTLETQAPLINDNVKGILPLGTYEICGTCTDKVSHFMNAFIEPVKDYFDLGYVSRARNLTAGKKWIHVAYPGKFVLVFVEGQLLGVIKTTGSESVVPDSHNREYMAKTNNPTFLALRNVVDGEGRVQLLTGGVYYVSHSILGKYIDEINRQGPYKNFLGPEMRRVEHQDLAFLRNFSVGILKLDSFGGHMIGGLFGSYHNMNSPISIFNKISPLDVEYRIEYVNKLTASPHYDAWLYKDLALLLDRLRLQIEGEIQSDPELNHMRDVLREASQTIFDVEQGPL